MAAKQVLFVLSAVLLQNAYSQCLNSLGGRGLTGVALDVEAVSSGAAGLSGYTNNYGLINNGLGLGNVGLLGNAGLVGAGLGNGIGLVGGLNGINAGLVNNGLYNGINLVGYPNLNSIGSSGPLAITTISPIGPSGLAVASENSIEGVLLASGALPFLSAVAFEGALPTAGSGVATCGCGNGAVGILSEGFPTTLPAPVYGIGSGIGGLYY